MHKAIMDTRSIIALALLMPLSHSVSGSKGDSELTCSGLKNFNNVGLFWSSEEKARQFYKLAAQKANKQLPREDFEKSVEQMLESKDLKAMILNEHCFQAKLIKQVPLQQESSDLSNSILQIEPSGIAGRAAQKLKPDDQVWVPAGMCEYRALKACPKALQIEASEDTTVSLNKTDKPTKETSDDQLTLQLYEFEVACNRGVKGDEFPQNPQLYASYCLNAAIYLYYGSGGIEPNAIKAQQYAQRACYYSRYSESCRKAQKLVAPKNSTPEPAKN